MKLLLSAHALRTWGPRIAAAVPGLDFVTAEEVTASGRPTDADIAFITREVTGASSKNRLTPELTAFIAVLGEAAGLRWIQAHSAGADRPIYGELRARGVKVTTASGATAVTVAQSALAAVLALSRRFPLLAAAQACRAWEPLLGPRAPRDLKGQCAVIAGLGPIGRTLAGYLTMLGLSVIGLSRSGAPVEGCARTHAYGDLMQVAPMADWLILACPASPLTRGMANAALFAALPAGAHLINVGRGELAVEAELTAALQSGQLAGAYLDVFEREPLDPASALWSLPNVIVSPHTSGLSQGQNEAVFEIFLDNLGRWHRGEGLRNDLDALSAG